jgi:hypothetical protein
MKSTQKNQKIFKAILNVSDDFRVALASYIKSQRMISISAEAIQYFLKDNYVEHTIEMQSILKYNSDEEKRRLRELVIEYIRERHYSIPKNFFNDIGALFEISDCEKEHKKRKKRKVNDI